MSPSPSLRDAVGQEIPGYLNASAGPRKPGLLVVHEWWGLNAQTRRMADRFAAEGFVVFAPDLFGGRVAQDEDEARALMQALQTHEAVTLMLRATAALKAQQSGAKVGVTGFCLGGALALAAASGIPGLAACVPFYGIPPAGKADLSIIRAAVQGHYANQDKAYPPERVDALEDTLKRSNVRHELFRYDAHHAFMNEERPKVYDAEAAHLAFHRAVDFLHRELD